MYHLTAGVAGLHIVPAALDVDGRTASRDLIDACLAALAMIGDREMTLAAERADYIARPIDTRTFASEVRKLLSSTG